MAAMALPATSVSRTPGRIACTAARIPSSVYAAALRVYSISCCDLTLRSCTKKSDTSSHEYAGEQGSEGGTEGGSEGGSVGGSEGSAVSLLPLSPSVLPAGQFVRLIRSRFSSIARCDRTVSRAELASKPTMARAVAVAVVVVGSSGESSARAAAMLSSGVWSSEYTPYLIDDR